MSEENVWTQMAIANDYHAGSRAQAALIVAENDRPGMVCGKCGGRAHYKHTVGTNKCVECGSLYVKHEWI